MVLQGAVAVSNHTTYGRATHVAPGTFRTDGHEPRYTMIEAIMQGQSACRNATWAHAPKYKTIPSLAHITYTSGFIALQQPSMDTHLYVTSQARK